MSRNPLSLLRNMVRPDRYKTVAVLGTREGGPLNSRSPETDYKGLTKAIWQALPRRIRWGATAGALIPTIALIWQLTMWSASALEARNNIPDPRIFEINPALLSGFNGHLTYEGVNPNFVGSFGGVNIFTNTTLTTESFNTDGILWLRTKEAGNESNEANINASTAIIFQNFSEESRMIGIGFPPEEPSEVAGVIIREGIASPFLLRYGLRDDRWAIQNVDGDITIGNTQAAWIHKGETIAFFLKSGAPAIEFGVELSQN